MKNPQLEAFRAKLQDLKKPSQKAVDEWREPHPIKDLAHISVLSFDNALASTGWALVVHQGDHWGIEVHKTGLIVPGHQDGLLWFEQSIQRAVFLRQATRDILDELWPAFDHVVYEMPAVHGHRVESSLMAAQAIVTAKTDLDLDLVPIQAVAKQKMAKNFLPPGQRDGKSPVKKMVERYVHFPEGRMSWNQHVHDAVANALEYMRQVREERGH